MNTLLKHHSKQKVSSSEYGLNSKTIEYEQINVIYSETIIIWFLFYFIFQKKCNAIKLLNSIKTVLTILTIWISRQGFYLVVRYIRDCREKLQGATG